MSRRIVLLEYKRWCAHCLHSELGHNIGSCVPSRMTSPLSWIATSMRRRAMIRPALASDAHSAGVAPQERSLGL